MEKQILEKLEKIENKYNRLKIMYLVSTIGLTGLMLLVSFKHVDSFDIIKAKGIVIQDQNGRDRILIGSPVPPSKDRVRTDSNLVKKYWASKFNNPDEYMGWYKKYKNTSNGIIFMNENGFDEVLVGDNLADANVGVRSYKLSGILVNDKSGWERVGAGVNTLDNGKTRQGFGVDDDSGEAMHMLCFEDGSKGLIIGGENGSLRIGMAHKPGELLQNKGKFTGIKFFDTNGKVIWEQDLTEKKK